MWCVLMFDGIFIGTRCSWKWDKMASNCHCRRVWIWWDSELGITAAAVRPLQTRALIIMLLHWRYTLESTWLVEDTHIGRVCLSFAIYLAIHLLFENTFCLSGITGGLPSHSPTVTIEQWPHRRSPFIMMFQMPILLIYKLCNRSKCYVRTKTIICRTTTSTNIKYNIACLRTQYY